MGLIISSVTLPSPGTPVVDRSGVLTKDFRAVIINLLNRTGGSDGAPKFLTGLSASAANPPVITGDWNEYDTVPAGGIAQFSQQTPLTAGADIIVLNNGANALLVQPHPSQNIDAFAAGVSYSLPVGLLQWFRVWTQTQIRSMFLYAPLTPTVSTVAKLPAANSVPQGTQRFVTDSNQTMTAGIGTTAAGGGANAVPVYSDGANWIIG